MGTARTIITDAMRALGALASGEAATADEGADGLRLLNLMLANWNTQELTVYTIQQSVLAVTAGVQGYTLGAGGTWNIPRPIRLETAVLRKGPVDYPMEIINYQEWQGIFIKGIQSTFSWYLYNDYGFPLSNCSIWPVPTENGQIVLTSWSQLGQFTNLSHDLTFPPAYELAMIYGLAVYMAPQFGREVTPALAGLAQQTFADLKRSSMRVPTLEIDQRLIKGTGRDTGHLSILTGE